MKEGDIYEHYETHKLYKIIGIGIFTETQEEVVIYQSAYSDKVYPSQIFVEPKRSFEEEIEYDDDLHPWSEPKFSRSQIPYQSSDSSDD